MCDSPFLIPSCFTNCYTVILLYCYTRLLLFDNSIALETTYQKQLGRILEARLTFEEHLKLITTIVNKTIGLLQELQKTLPRPVLITMYKAFVRAHLDYGDIIFNEAHSQKFH